MIVTDFTVRPGRAEDAMACADVDRKETFADEWHPEDFLATLQPWSRIRWKVAVDARGEVIGFVVYAYRRRAFCLLNIGVRCDCRRQGVGEELLMAAFGRFDNSLLERFVAWAWESNIAGRNFLRKHGLREIKTLPETVNHPHPDRVVFYGISRTRYLLAGMQRRVNA